jgi:PhzF family phenazine biosynthesis protein
MAIEIFQVDAFTDKPFAGNPAAVCILSGPAEETWMQNVAKEMNLSETAFLYRHEEGFNLRWFTPSVEVELCGHATLASAHILWDRGLLGPDEQVRFHTLSGLLVVRQAGDMIEMNFPATPEEPASVPDALAQALGVKPLYVGRSAFDYLVEVPSEDMIRGISPDYNALKTFPVRGVIVTSRAEAGPYDFVSRFFGPAVGIPEDPVTGSAHCCLGPFWSRKIGRNEFLAYQASQRGGIIRVRVDEDRVYLGGKAVTVLQGQLLCD